MQISEALLGEAVYEQGSVTRQDMLVDPCGGIGACLKILCLLVPVRELTEFNRCHSRYHWRCDPMLSVGDAMGEDIPDLPKLIDLPLTSTNLWDGVTTNDTRRLARENVEAYVDEIVVNRL
jgi:hypothetical protein